MMKQTERSKKSNLSIYKCVIYPGFRLECFYRISFFRMHASAVAHFTFGVHATVLYMCSLLFIYL